MFGPRTYEDTLRFIESAPTAALTSYYSRLSLKLVKIGLHIGFIVTCQEFQLKPSFVSYRINTSSNSLQKRLESTLLKKWLDSEKRSHYAKKAMTLDLLFRVNNRLSGLLDPSTYRHLSHRVERRKSALFTDLRRSKLRKLYNLSRSTCTSNSLVAPSVKFSPPVINLSNTVISDNELRLLTYGKKFALPPTDKVKTIHSTLLADLATGIRNDQRLNTQRVTDLINSATKNLLSNPTPPDFRAFKKT